MAIEDIKRYPFSERDRLLLDANIWLYAYGPNSYKFQNRCSSTYSQELTRIRLSRCRVFINEIILSEFINRYARTEWEKYLEDHSYLDFKEYRDTSDFKPIAEDIWYGVKEILSMVEGCIETRFTKEKAHNFIDEYKGGNVDFNDQILKDICLCSTEKLVFVTNDKDFGALRYSVWVSE